MYKQSALLVAGVMLVACAADGGTASLPYTANLTTIIGDYDDASDEDDRSRTVPTPDDDACVDEDSASCVKPQDTCGPDGVADVLLDVHGAVRSVICYPTSGVSVQNVEGDIEHVGNNVVLVLDDVADDADITGDVTIDGNNVVLFGYGPATSLIDGNLYIDKNNAIVRGIHVAGDVVIDKNNASLIDCVIEGNLTVHGNNTSIGLCDVWGEVTISGNNTVLVADRVASLPAIAGHNTVCNAAVLFTDANGDAVVGLNELGAPIACGDDSKKDK